jgi:hypothetical protein
MGKVCKRCGVEKEFTEFYPHKHHKDGLNTYCKPCEAEVQRLRRARDYANNREIKNAKKRQWYDTRREIIQKETHDHYINNTHMHKARQAILREKRRGAAPVSEFVCVACGAIAEQFHHFSYELEYTSIVIPVCRRCHMQHHAGTLNITLGPWFAMKYEAPK